MPSADLWSRIKEGVISIIEDLPEIKMAGAGMARGRVIGQMLDDTSNLDWPCIVVSIDGLTETPMPGTTEATQAEWPVLVVIRDQTEPKRRHENERLYLGWRKAIFDAFNQRRRVAAGVPFIPVAAEVYRTKVNPRPAIAPQQARAWYPTVVSALEIRCEAMERRHPAEAAEEEEDPAAGYFAPRYFAPRYFVL